MVLPRGILLAYDETTTMKGGEVIEDIIDQAELVLRQTPGYMFVASNGMQLMLTPDEHLQILSPDGKTNIDVSEAKIALLELLLPKK
jgi:hypothetical protein